jgi:hypothetical protein
MKSRSNFSARRNGFLGIKHLQKHLFAYAQGCEPEWEDPNGELMEAVKAWGGKILKRSGVDR